MQDINYFTVSQVPGNDSCDKLTTLENNTTLLIINTVTSTELLNNEDLAVMYTLIDQT